MGAASNVISVGATDDLNTIPREDDIIAEYSSRGPRADNGDGYPFDELKPDVSAPGTHIMQCEFDPYGDGSGNGYGNRGSGTSYATPLVAGVVALMLEANPSMDPYLVREILRFTSERRGEPSMPDVDPFWNREFGWGMVDAYRAVSMALVVAEPAEVDVELQCYMTELKSRGGSAVMHGISWARTGEVEAVEISVDGGAWQKASKGSNGTWESWTAELEPEEYGGGNHTIRARAVGIAGGRHSLEDSSWFTLGEPREASLMEDGNTILWLGVGAILIVAAAIVVKLRKEKDEDY
jgi:hypothetical protein